jgi:hypothetical protein
MKEGKLLGHIVSAEGVRIDPSKVEAIQALSFTRSKKEVQSFLGKINFLRRFISNFVELVKHITTMLRKGNEVKWTAESRNYFDQVKRDLTEALCSLALTILRNFLYLFLPHLIHWLLFCYIKIKRGYSSLFPLSVEH